MLHQALCIISNPWVKSSFSYSLEMLNWGQNWWFFVPHDLEIWWMTLKNNSAPLLHYISLCAPFQIHWWIQTVVTVRKRSIWVKIGIFCPVWPWNLMDEVKINDIHRLSLFQQMRMWSKCARSWLLRKPCCEWLNIWCSSMNDTRLSQISWSKEMSEQLGGVSKTHMSS